MSTEKKVIFGAVNQTSSTINQISSDSDRMAKKNIANAKEEIFLYKEQIKLLKEKAIEQSKDLTFQSRAGNRGDREAELSSGQTRKSLQDTNKQIKLFEDLIKEIKESNTNAKRAEADSSKKIRREDDQWQAKKSLWRQEVQYDKGGVRKRISAAEKLGFEGMDPEQAEKLMYQKTIAGGEREKSGGIFGQVFAGTLAAGIVQQIGRSMSTIVSSQTGEQAFNSLLGIIPFVGGTASATEQRVFEEQYSVQAGTNKLRAMTGNAGLSIGGNTNLGYSTRENVESAGGIISASGRQGGYGQYGEQSRFLERGMGLSQQTIIQMIKDVRTARSTAEITQIAADIIKANPELRKDQTKFSEILAQTSQLTNTLAAQTENVNQTQVAGIVGQLRSIGGSFADPVLGGRNMMSINQSLTNPGNDFQKARSFGVLSGLKPGMSYFQMMEAQEKGLGQAGYLEGTLKQLEREHGGGEGLMMAVQQSMGLGASTSRKLVEARAKNPGMFANFKGSSEDLEQMVGSDRASKFTAEKDIHAAKMSEAALGGSWDLIGEGISQTFNHITKAFEPASKAIMDFSERANAALQGYTPGEKTKSGKVATEIMYMDENGIMQNIPKNQ